MSNKQAFSLVAQSLKRLSQNAHRDLKASFAVSFTAPYAIYVHEDMQAQHPNGGQAKYLQQPLRENTSNGVLAKMVKDLMTKEKQSLRTALLITAHWLLQESKKLVPVDTGKLRDSGEIRIAH